jgi:hypothetical protein
MTLLRNLWYVVHFFISLTSQISVQLPDYSDHLKTGLPGNQMVIFQTQITSSCLMVGTIIFLAQFLVDPTSLDHFIYSGDLNTGQV